MSAFRAYEQCHFDDDWPTWRAEAEAVANAARLETIKAAADMEV